MNINNLKDLPSELINDICNYLDSGRDISMLLQTSRGLRDSLLSTEFGPFKNAFFALDYIPTLLLKKVVNVYVGPDILREKIPLPVEFRKLKDEDYSFDQLKDMKLPVLSNNIKNIKIDSDINKRTAKFLFYYYQFQNLDSLEIRRCVTHNDDKPNHLFTLSKLCKLYNVNKKANIVLNWKYGYKTYLKLIIKDYDYVYKYDDYLNNNVYKYVSFKNNTNISISSYDNIKEVIIPTVDHKVSIVHIHKFDVEAMADYIRLYNIEMGDKWEIVITSFQPNNE